MLPFKINISKTSSELYIFPSVFQISDKVSTKYLSKKKLSEVKCIILLLFQSGMGIILAWDKPSQAGADRIDDQYDRLHCGLVVGE